MKHVSVIVVATASTLVLSAAAWRSERPLDPNESHARAEVVRLRAHFDSVDTELRARDVSHLSAAQRASRTRLIAWLREYREAGDFPQNDRFVDKAVPFFRDSRGTLCAMAYLVDRSARGDIVDHIAKTRNNAFIRDLTDDRALVAWLNASGLSVSEAARIQPAYDWPPNPDPRADDLNVVSGEYAMRSIALGGASLGTLGFNLLSPGRVSGTAGLLAGAATILVSLPYLGDNDGREKFARANTMIGSLALIAGTRALLTKSRSRRPVPAQTSKHEFLTETRVTPDLIVDKNATRFGLRMQARF